jgi:acetyl esterase/lipase
MVSTAKYYAARGWVVFSVNYRLEQDFGSIPPGWPPNPLPAIYPAGRDAKAAVRWVHTNAAAYNVSTEHITVFGGSAGGMLSLMLGISEPSDYRDELDITADPTLATTNLSASAEVQTVVIFWGNDSLLRGLEVFDGHSRYDPGDAPTLLVHGDNDVVVPLFQAQMVYQSLLAAAIPAEFHTLIGQGHAAWGASLEDGRTILEAAFDFIVGQQGLEVRLGYLMFLPLIA